MKILLKNTQAGRNTFNHQFAALSLHLSTKIPSHLDCSLAVSARSITSKLRNTFSESGSNYSTLSKALRCRHRKSCLRRYKLEITIHSLLHLSHRHLSRSRSLILRDGSICIWSTILQTIYA